MRVPLFGKKLYVGGLNYKCEDEELRELLSGYGDVVSAIIVKDKEKGGSKGFAFVEMDSLESAQLVVDELNESLFMGRTLIVNEAKEKEPAKRESSRSFESVYVPGTSKLYVGNLPFSITEDDIKTLFSSSGKVKSVKIVTDKTTGKSKGFSFIEMINEIGAKNAVEDLNGKVVGGRIINVNSARDKVAA